MGRNFTNEEGWYPSPTYMNLANIELERDIAMKRIIVIKLFFFNVKLFIYPLTKETQAKGIMNRINI